MTQVWSLPGPRRYVGEVMLCVERGRHVVAVLPSWLAEDAERVAPLSDAIVEACRDAVVVDLSRDAPLVELLGEAVHDGFGVGPATVPELLAWKERRAATFVLIASEVSSTRRGEVMAFLSRLEVESRSAGLTAGTTFIVLGAASDLPEALTVPGGDVAVATRWFWNRITRWDTLALLADTDDAGGASTLGDEIRVETIAEVARWNLELAARLAGEWDGTTATLAIELARGDRRTGAVVPDAIGNKAGTLPPPSVLQAWNAGDVECWRGRVSVAPLLASDSTDAVSRFVWSAQARVLLPFIDEKRMKLEDTLRELLGALRFGALVEARSATPVDERWVQAPVPELAVLRTIVFDHLRHRDRRLLPTATALRDARNRLAHLTPLTTQEVADLETRCHWLA